jgi:hypothetical protein
MYNVHYTYAICNVQYGTVRMHEECTGQYMVFRFIDFPTQLFQTTLNVEYLRNVSISSFL